jgi:transketolase
MPGLVLVRPADANETAQAWRLAVESEEPVGLVLTRQDIPVLAETADRAKAGVEKGGYVLAELPGDSAGLPQIVLIGTGSEVQLCLGAAKVLADAGRPTRVVSLPCWEWFEEQGDAYRDEILPPGVPVLSVEAGSTFGWSRYADASIGLDTFGASAPGAVAMEEFGFTVEHVVERAQALVGGKAS